MLSAFLYITIRKTNAELFKQHMSFGSPEGFCSTKVRENASPYGMLKDICGTFQTAYVLWQPGRILQHEGAGKCFPLWDVEGHMRDFS